MVETRSVTELPLLHLTARTLAVGASTLLMAGIAPAGQAVTGTQTSAVGGAMSEAAVPSGTLLVGDSLGVSVQPRLEAKGYSVDAQVGRQFDAAEPILRQAGDGVPANVVVELGTNGTISPADCKAVVRTAGRMRRVFLVTSRVPRTWEHPNLATIADCNQTFARPRVRVINWYGRSAGHPEWFAADEVHLSADGQRAFKRVINRAVKRKGLN